MCVLVTVKNHNSTKGLPINAHLSYLGGGTLWFCYERTIYKRYCGDNYWIEIHIEKNGCLGLCCVC